MRSPRLHPILLAVTFVAFVASARATAQDVTVKKEQPTAETRVIDPKNPPPEKKNVPGNHPAFTWCNYSANWSFHYDVGGEGRSGVRLTMRQMDLTLKLHSTLWLPEGASQRLVAHEQGHKKIGERSFRLSETIARQLALEIVIGRTFTGESEKAACDKAGNAWLDAYLTAVRNPAQRVHDIYDEITNHGNNRNVTEDDAIKQAIERYRAERKTKASTASTADK